MQLPLTDPDRLFEELLQDLPPETVQMAREFKAFVRAKKVQTPEQLLRVVFLLLWLGQILARGGGDLYGTVRGHHGPIGGGALARMWSMGASAAPADAAAGPGRHAASGAPLGGH
jgi:hypothetical protein